MKNRLHRYLIYYVLPNIVPVLFIIFLYFGYGAFIYIKDFYYPGSHSSFDDLNKIDRKDFEASIYLEGEPKIEKSQRTLTITIKSIEISVYTESKKTISQFCIRDFLLSWEIFGKVDSASRIISSPVCLTLDDKHKQDQVVDSEKIHYRFDIFELEPKPNFVSATTTLDRGALYPFDSETYHLMSWINYSLTYQSHETDEGIISPFLSIVGGLENLMEDNRESHISGRNQMIKIESNKNSSGIFDFPENFLGRTLSTCYYTIIIERPLIHRVLFVAVFTLILGLTIVTFLIKDTGIYLESVLVFFFGFLGIKQMFPLPADLSINVSLIDLLLLLSYFLIGISGINFIIKKYLDKFPPELPKTTIKKSRSQSKGRKSN